MMSDADHDRDDDDDDDDDDADDDDDDDGWRFHHDRRFPPSPPILLITQSVVLSVYMKLARVIQVLARRDGHRWVCCIQWPCWSNQCQLSATSARRRIGTKMTCLQLVVLLQLQCPTNHFLLDGNCAVWIFYMFWVRCPLWAGNHRLSF